MEVLNTPNSNMNSKIFYTHDNASTVSGQDNEQKSHKNVKNFDEINLNNSREFEERGLYEDKRGNILILNNVDINVMVLHW
ncbi:hypothetical protein A3Q56_03443 [Intoshia linei]|uniref:Uncharacterized protein n=1 Tax=Intoshia linei TaxID=1819745 RepID=A0A177B3E0_9BILA|nr:hypothetical protein A3Q56_03443 [Intoshia linei]